MIDPMSRLTQQLVATALATIIAVVSCTGEALYYLLEADSGQSIQAEGHPHDSFHHHHGDGLWHHHGPAQRPTSSDKTDTAEKPRTFNGEPVARVDVPHRHDHSTLLLAVVSAIELSLSNAPAVVEDSQQISNCSEFAGDCVAHWFQPTLGARGPPLRVV